jgi:exosortase J
MPAGDRHSRIPPVFYAGAVMALVAVGSFSLSPLWQTMYSLWSTDPLRSIGAIFPLVACAGVIAAWHRLGWSMNGTFWALPLIAISILLARAIVTHAFVVSYNGQRLINCGIALFLYGIGVVLLFGGRSLLRASIAPLCLLLCINPVPSVFNSAVDLPLQYLAASTARAFAHLIGLQLTGVNLRMMFAPDFGMFIAPGCNGVRGAITLGYLALIFGYARHLRPRTLAITALIALLMGYVLNFLRLCILVIYYWIGISFPSIQKHGAGVDYAIGCTLFLFAALGLGLLIRSLETRTVADGRNVKQTPGAGWPGGARRPSYATAARALCFLVITLVFIVPELLSAAWHPAPAPNEQQVLGSFPAKVGPYMLTRTWAEHNSNGMIVLAMAEYRASPGTGATPDSFTLGLWVGSANHIIANCKFAQGIQSQWHGSFKAMSWQAFPVHFVTNFYDDGISRQYDAESICTSSGCTGYPGISSHKVFVFTAPNLSNLIFVFHGKSLPILLRREWLDSDTTPSADLRAQFEASAQIFMEQINLRSLLIQDGYRF